MKSLLICICISSLFLAGCGREGNQAEAIAERPKAQEKTEAEAKPASYSVTDALIEAPPVAEKIIKNADLTLEVTSPVEAQRKVGVIAGNRGGFVVSSESKQRESSDPNNRQLDVSLVLRVPAAQFEASLEEVRGLGTRILQDKTSGQDVTEEFIDLEARIKAQQALEVQFLTIMKQAVKVSDALEVQRQISEVRTEIEKLEGRKRFLDNRASLSTISVNLQSPRAIIASSSGFGQTLKDSVSDAVAVATGIVLFLIRSIIIMVPVFVLLLLPAWLLVRAGFRRAKRLQLARKLETVPES